MEALRNFRCQRAGIVQELGVLTDQGYGDGYHSNTFIYSKKTSSSVLECFA